MRKVIPLAVAGGVLIASGGVFGVAQALAKDIEVSQDGVPMKVRTWDGTVGEVLQDQGITVGEHDLVLPGLTAAVADGQAITVRYGRELRLTVDGQSESLWTTALTLDEALSERSIRDESIMSASRSAVLGREGLAVDIKTAKKVNLLVAGEPREVISPAATVGDLLKDANVELTPEDRVDPVIETPIAEDMAVTVNKNENRETTKTVDVPFKVVRKNSSSLASGTEKVDTEGVPGRAVETWVERFENGKSVKNERVSSKVEKEPVDKVILVGTRTATTSPSPSTQSNSSSRSNQAPTQTQAASPSQSQSVTPANGASCVASNYADPQATANGEQFNPNALTAAHKTLPFNTRVKVTNPRNGKTVIVRINDRGPYVGGRCLDLSRAAFAQIGDLGQGVMTVTYEVL